MENKFIWIFPFLFLSLFMDWKMKKKLLLLNNIYVLLTFFSFPFFLLLSFFSQTLFQYRINTWVLQTVCLSIPPYHSMMLWIVISCKTWLDHEETRISKAGVISFNIEPGSLSQNIYNHDHQECKMQRIKLQNATKC